MVLRRTVGQQIEPRRWLTYYNIAKMSDRVDNFLEIEDVREEMRHAWMDVDDQWCFLPSEYDLEI